MSMTKWLAGALTLLTTMMTMSAMTPADAQRRQNRQSAEQWVKLGEQTVGFNVERDTIQVGREEGRFRAVKLVVKRNDVFLVDLKVTYRNGESDDLAVNQRIRANSETGTLALQPGQRGNARVIERVDMVYRSRPGFGGQAIAEIWGLRADEAWGGGGPGAGYGGPPPDRYINTELPRGFVLFGSQTVGFQAERDVIRLGREVGRFGRLAIRVLRNDILLREIVVNYSRGETQRLPLNAEISANGVTTPIDIKDGRIETIELIYQARPGFRGQAVVEVYGEYAQSYLGDRGRADYSPPRGGQQQWLLLGAQRAEMLKPESDVFPVGRQFGKFRQIKVRAVGHAIDVFGIVVTYGNGEREEVPIRASLRGGQESPPLDLRGDERFIESVEMRYRTKLNFGGTAKVELYGLH